MLEEGAAQARENQLSIDFIRAEGTTLPFRAGILGGIIHAHALGRIEDPPALFREVARVLAPRARYVATAVASRRILPNLRWVGGHPYSERDLRIATANAGLTRFERIQIDTTLVFKVEKP